MASRLPLRLQTRTAVESLWCHTPPSFLAPILASSHLHFSTTSSLGWNIRQLKKRKQVHRDEYTLRQVKARRDANLSRQAVLKEQKAKELGDPIRGIPTPFVESFDTEVPQEIKQDPSAVSLEAVKANPDTPPPSPAYASEEKHLDHGIKHEELARSLEFSRYLTRPLPPPSSTIADPDQEAQAHERWESRDASATEAVQRIVSLTNASSKHRTKKNTERIIETFGRHNTDHILKPKGPAVVKHNPLIPPQVPTPRTGPDTGSSEVQIGILTAKIRVLADRYEGPNRNDKVNKRNLRLLLHRRQKLLAYMERKERGSERWQRMISFLGLTPACWKGEIAVQ
ncbi:hypothetical protein HO173_002477 [Letharia columbiana]|uniref:Ribosomal protein S15 n=1 Tax=Letharia columbiana TaxID=112416 RepID=A0A8H6L849_9LECA|nr:uncharacterized protein HO173_002477 [Letharia columbiana]KAF6239216.1 hypothetical protein HO173_002477 [Letharia columbiana]